MGNMKRVLFAAMLMALVIVVTGCGRDDNNMTTTPMTTQTPTQATTTMGETMENGGILQDMVDGVEEGLDRLDPTDDRNSADNRTVTDNMNSATKGQ